MSTLFCHTITKYSGIRCYTIMFTSFRIHISAYFIFIIIFIFFIRIKEIIYKRRTIRKSKSINFRNLKLSVKHDFIRKFCFYEY